MVALPLLLALSAAAPSTPPCNDLGPTSTLADQFVCYRTAGRKVVVPGSGYLNGFDGPGCIGAVGADRVEITNCSPSSFDRRSVTIPFVSIQAIDDTPNAANITVRLVALERRYDCGDHPCEYVVVAPTPEPPSASAGPRLVAKPIRP